MGRLRWAKFAGTVRPSTVVVPNVLREHHTRVPLTEDQRVGKFGSEGAHEPFGETVRPGATQWNPGTASMRRSLGELPVPGRMAHLVGNAAEWVTVLMFR